jgi:hypothetical protein
MGKLSALSFTDKTIGSLVCFILAIAPYLKPQMRSHKESFSSHLIINR